MLKILYFFSKKLQNSNKLTNGASNLDAHTRWQVLTGLAKFSDIFIGLILSLLRLSIKI